MHATLSELREEYGAPPDDDDDDSKWSNEAAMCLWCFMLDCETSGFWWLSL